MCSTIGLERITGLALMQIKYRMELNLDEMIIFFWTTSVMLIAKPLIKGGDSTSNLRNLNTYL